MSLIGDTIDITASNMFEPFFINQTAVPVGDGIEATGLLFGLEPIQIDVHDDSFDIIIPNQTGLGTIFNGSIITLSDLDWVNIPTGVITDVTSTGAPGTAISFTDDTITINLGVGNINVNGPTTFSFDIECFFAGTHILTDRGEIPVEELKIGDLVKTADGQLEPIKWIGRQTVNPRQVKKPLHNYPVLVKAGALGHNTPSRDLYISPNHSLLVDGLLINAGALVNDISILKTEPTQTFVYYHIELDKHALLVAEGTHAESYFPQKEDRLCYDNWAEYEELYPHDCRILLWPLDYPRISSRVKVPRFVKQQLMEVAKALCGKLAA